MNMCMIQVYDMCLYMSMHAVCMRVCTRTHALFACVSEGAYVPLSVYEVQKTALSVGLFFERGSLVLCCVCEPSWPMSCLSRCKSLGTTDRIHCIQFYLCSADLKSGCQDYTTFYTLVQQALLNLEIILRNADLRMPLLHNLWMLVSFYVSCQKREWELVLL